MGTGRKPILNFSVPKNYLSLSGSPLALANTIYFFFPPATTYDKAAPGLNLRTFLAGMVMDSPVAGLRPSLPARSDTEKVPDQLTGHCRHWPYLFE